VADPLLAGLALSAGYRVSGVETLTGPGPGQFLADDGNLARLQALFEAVCQGRTQTREGCCEVCFGPLHIRGGGGFCPVCNAAADSAGRVRYEDSRWHPERLRRHYEEWILSTRELYRCDRPRILQKINELNLKEPSAGR
jgi:predicted amidophosphoribosyltransferase